MEREHGRRRNRSAEKLGEMTNVGASREGTQSSCPLRPPTQGPGRQMSSEATKMLSVTSSRHEAAVGSRGLYCPGGNRCKTWEGVATLGSQRWASGQAPGLVRQGEVLPADLDPFPNVPPSPHSHRCGVLSDFWPERGADQHLFEGLCLLPPQRWNVAKLGGSVPSRGPGDPSLAGYTLHDVRSHVDTPAQKEELARP